MDKATFQALIKQGIPSKLPSKKPYPKDSNRAPKRKDVLSPQREKVGIKERTSVFSYGLAPRTR